MKKSLVLAMAMALGVTASAYAANPFSDVPAGHWAYDSIDKLAAAGVIEGMGDGSYQGDRTMTRYEMAQIVAKAMAKGCNVDKLAAEFADELDALGVRVAALEKKADNVKITGAVNMYSRKQAHDTWLDNYDHGYWYRLRTDLTLKGQINEDWTYTALMRNDQELSKTKGAGDEGLAFQRAYVNGRVAGLAVQAGRYNRLFGNGEVYATRVDGIEASYGKKVKATVGYAQLTGAAKEGKEEYGKDAKVLFGEVKTGLSKAADIEVDYYAFKDMAETGAKAPIDDDFNVLVATVNYAFTKNVKLTGSYLKSDANVKGWDDDGYAVKLAYKGASAAKPGSWGMYAKYVDLPKSVMIGSNYTTNQDWVAMANGGVKGVMLGANYALAKNIVGTVEYSVGEAIAPGQTYDGDKADALFAGVAFTF